jgi:hypothetical protein
MVRLRFECLDFKLGLLHLGSKINSRLRLTLGLQ